MKFKDKGAKMLFLKYALPCSETLVKRGVISQNYRKKLIKVVFLNKKIPENSEKKFKTANIMCEKIAKKLGKKAIDEVIIRKYFLFNHDKAIKSRYKIFKDFDSLLCRTYSGKVIKLKNRNALIETIIGKRSYKTIFVPKLKIGNYVVVHRNFVVEKIDENLAKKLENKRKLF
jgi:hydrogenase maturation factor